MALFKSAADFSAVRGAQFLHRLHNSRDTLGTLPAPGLRLWEFRPGDRSRSAAAAATSLSQRVMGSGAYGQPSSAPLFCAKSGDFFDALARTGNYSPRTEWVYDFVSDTRSKLAMDSSSAAWSELVSMERRSVSHFPQQIAPSFEAVTPNRIHRHPQNPSCPSHRR